MEIQDRSLLLNLKEARKRAIAIIDEQGGINSEKLGSKKLEALIKRFRMPVANRTIEQLILYSLGLPHSTKVTNCELRRAIVTALYTPLRQNVGSCFATAPAILIQNEQPERLLLDLFDLTMTCSLSRTFAGVENRVPISPSWGKGDLNKPVDLQNPDLFKNPSILLALERAGVSVDQARSRLPSEGIVTVETLLSQAAPENLEIAKNTFKTATDHALLKTWEYTLASFTDFKIEFYRWNLYASLGFDSKEKGGIGELLYKHLEQKLDETNQDIEKLHQDYVRAVDEVRVTQALLKQTTSYDRLRQLKAELQIRSHHANACEELRESAHVRAESLSTFFKFLLEAYSEKFQEYFQEIYDAEMFDVQTGLYDDSPAGFRLVYKHGRRDPLAWTLIHTSEEYIQALNDFFLATEPMIQAECEWEDGKQEIEELTTKLIHHIREDIFLASAIERMGKAHKTKQKGNSLENIERFEKKPWSYTSGGTMHTLIRCYYCIENELTEESRTIESPMDLLVYLLDLLKSLPYPTMRPFESHATHSMLMYSPTHAFNLRPGLSPFKEGWLDKGFSYTWARDRALLPGQTFYEPIRLDFETQTFLAERFFDKIPFIPQENTLTIPEFRAQLFDQLKAHFPSLELLSDHLDGFLRTAFPLLTPPDLEKIASSLSKKEKELFLKERPLLSTFAEAYKRLPPKHAKKAFAKHKLCPPQPLLFADTNWSRFYFAIGYNPGIGELDLWRIDPESEESYPLSIWRSYLDGSNPGKWGVLTDPSEYRGDHLPDFKLLRKV